MKQTRLVIIVAGLMALLTSSGLSFQSDQAADEQHKKQIAQGRELYQSHCASCHGLDGRGRGPGAPSLRKRPADLTVIRKKDGRFPAEQLRKIISGETVLPVHGEREMPVWGSVLKEQELTSLIKYLESIQRFPDQYPGR